MEVVSLVHVAFLIMVCLLMSGFSGCWEDEMRINRKRTSISQYTASLRDVRLDGCPDVISASSSSCATSIRTDVSQRFKTFALDDGLRPFTVLH